MQLQLSLVVPASGAHADVLLQVDAGTPLAAVQDELLCRVAPAQSGRELWVGAHRLTGREPLGRPPLVHGALMSVGPRPGPAGSTFTLHCLGGPDAGGRWALPNGEAVLGRGAGAHVRVDDPLISRAHCTLRVADGQVLVTDLATTNGTTVDGAPVTAPSTPLRAGAVLGVGRSRFSVVVDDDDAVPTRPDGAGCVAVNRPPRRRPADQHSPIHFPEAPTAHERRPLPVLAVLAPLVVGVVLWRVLGSATFLLFTLLSPVMVIGSAVTDVRAGRRQHRRAVATHRRSTAAAREQLRAAVRIDQQARRARWPDPAATTGAARSPGERLWERRRGDDDVLSISIGTAEQRSAVEVVGQPPPDATATCHAPVVVPVDEHGVLGIAGHPATAHALARWVTVQAAVWHSPRDLQLVVLASTGAAADWEWSRWLPHLRPTDGQPCRVLLGIGVEQAAARVSELRSLIGQREARPRRGPRPRRVLVVVDGGAALRDLPGLRELLEAGPASGVHAVVVEGDRRLLPGSCGALAVVDDAAGVELVLGGRSALTGAVVDGVSTRTAEDVARALAPLRDTGRDDGTDADLPRTVSWADLVGLRLRGDRADVDAVLDRWADGGSPTAVLGMAADGPFSVDLCADGPHALVAGTTGSGKSELLQTWIASLALGNAPDTLNLVLLDYKGGAAFGPCAGLPHVVGMVTDLDGALAARALASLAAELRRREALLAGSGARDLQEHRRRGGPPLPRLVLVVDEFASLAEELPDFVGGLVDIAMRGRSLGVHLVLATQRPGGVVSADIRANTNLTLCLAVARDTDSRDVLDSPVAAHLSRAAPGRGFVRTGHAELTAVQVARVSGPRRSSAECAQPRVVLVPAVELGDPVAQVGTAAGDDTELALLVDACASAAARLGIPASVPPWLPALPASLALAELPPYDDSLATRAGRLAPLVIGRLDLPEQQRQPALVLDLDAWTHLLVVGAPRSGRTTVLRTIAGALAATSSPEHVHLYVVDATGHGLRGLSDVPHVGAVVTRGETDRLERMLSWLTAEVHRRQQVLASAGWSSLSEQRAAVDAMERLPALMLLVDGFDAFLSDHQDRDADRLIDGMHALLREGPAAGLHVVVTGGRSVLTGRLSALVETRLVLRLADHGDYSLAGVPARLVESSPAPGRGWLVDGHGCLTAQVALLGDDGSGPAQQAALADLSRRHAGATRHRPHGFRPLPQRVTRDELAVPLALPPARVVLGAGGDDGSPVVADISGGFVVAGPPGSGRSTALCTVGRGLRDSGLPLVGIALRASPLRELTADCLTDEDIGRLQQLLDRGPCALLVDDAELLVQSTLAPLLETTVRRARDSGHLVVAAGTTDDLVLGYRGFVVDLRRGRSGVLLSPQGAADGDLLGVRIARPTGADGVPGRGLLCRRSVAEPIQVAL